MPHFDRNLADLRATVLRLQLQVKTIQDALGVCAAERPVELTPEPAFLGARHEELPRARPCPRRVSDVPAAKIVPRCRRRIPAYGRPAVDAKLTEPFGIDFDRTGKAYLVELKGNRLLSIDRSGRLTTLAGTGNKGDGGDGGPAAKAEFNGPHNVAVTPDGDIYVADTWNNRVRKLDGKTGVISTVAGTGVKGFSGDGGPAAKAQFGASTARR